jgi:hypothetical protein
MFWMFATNVPLPAGNASVDESVRFSAMEMLIVYAERKPAQFRKVQGAMDGTLTTLFEYIDTVDHDDEWSNNLADRDEDDEANEEVEMAEASLDRLISAVGGAKIVPHVLALAQQRWQSQRYAPPLVRCGRTYFVSARHTGSVHESLAAITVVSSANLCSSSASPYFSDTLCMVHFYT